MTRRTLFGIAFLTLVVFAVPAVGQTGRVTGTVTKSTDGKPVVGVRISVDGTPINSITGPDGRYVLPRVPEGPQVILFRWLGFRPQQATVTVRSATPQNVDIALVAQIISLNDIVVASASRVPERTVEAPAAISTIDRVTLRNKSISGQIPAALAQTPGVDIVQSGVNDFNLNARGFNSSLNRRVLVLQDGRDLAIAFLGSQEWNSLSMPMEDFAQVEMVRGPGSALYGANAFTGVLNITTPPARDVVGTKLSLGGGELSTVRGDLRHAGVTNDGRFGFRFNGGYYRSDSFSRSRTAFNGSDVIGEYNDAADVPLVAGTTAAVPSCTGLSNCLFIERVPLSGQTSDPTTGLVSGSPDELQNIYGSARFDFYADDGSMFTAEGGAARVENGVFVTGIGRVQVPEAVKPWARLAWGNDNVNVMAWYSGRKSLEDQVSLSSGIGLKESSSILHAEGQFNESFDNDRLRLVAGASDGTLMSLLNDDRSDNYFSGFAQLEYRPTPQIRFLAAARVDNGTLFDTQFSPKGAIVFSPNENHSLRATVNHAFQTPNYSEFFLNVPAGLPTAALAGAEVAVEAPLSGYYAQITDPLVVGPALAGAMSALNLNADLPWNFLPQTLILAQGNPALEVEKVTGFEIGYKGTIDNRAYISVDVYLNKLSNFVTDLLPGVNPAFAPFDLSTTVPADLAQIDAILAGAGLPANHPLRVGAAQLLAGYEMALAGVQGATGPALTTVGGAPAIVVSYANAGKVDEMGVEFGIGYGITPELKVDASYTYFDFDVKDGGFTAAGQDLIPNTPKHKGSGSLTYTGQQGFDAGASVRINDSFDWAAGVFTGRVPSNQFIDANVGFRVNNYLRIYVVASNLLDQQRFQLYGGSIIGRRILGGMTATF